MIEALVNGWAAWDTDLFTRIFAWKGRRFFSRLMYWVSRSADGHVYPLIIVTALVCGLEDAVPFSVALLASFAIELPAYKFLKGKIRRARPCDELAGTCRRIDPPDRFSFPSGHTAGAFVFARVVSAFIPVLAVPLHAWAACVGLSRVYNGVHYPTDVLVGAALGLASAQASLALLR